MNSSKKIINTVSNKIKNMDENEKNIRRKKAFANMNENEKNILRKYNKLHIFKNL